MTSTQTTLPLSGLRLDTKGNVRKIGRGASPAFIASIRTMGVKQPLLVRPNGSGHLVTDGGKRLEALQALAKAGDIPADHPVPVIIEDVNDATARETSLTLNVIREAMHPVDEFRAFAALHRDKEQPLDADAIASHFGVPRRQVEQSLALGSLADPILDAWRDGQINEEAAQAFTLCPSKKAQVTIFEQLSKRDGQVNRWAVKQALKIGQENAGRMLAIVGQAAYEKAGGKVTVDLFGGDHVVSDAVLLQKLVGEKLTATCEKLIAAGWSWATSDLPENHWQYGRLEAKGETKEQRAQLDALRRKFDDLEEQGLDEESPEAIELDRQIEAIEAVVAANAYSQAQKAKAGCFVGINHRGDAVEISCGRVKPAEEHKAKADAKAAGGKKPKAKATLSKALADRLKEQREKAIKSALVAHAHKDPLATLLAGIVAAQIQPGRWNAAPQEVSNRFNAIADAIDPKVMNAALRKAFDASDYFSGAPKAFTLAAITEAVNADESRKLAGKKRSEIAKFATANVGKTKWLPKELRTSHYDGPKPKAKRK